MRKLDTILTLFQQKGWLEARGRQHTDSTHVLTKIRALNRVLSVWETMRAALADARNGMSKGCADFYPTKRGTMSPSFLAEAYRWFVDSGFCLVLNPSNGDHLSSNCSAYAPEIDAISRAHKLPLQRYAEGLIPCDQLRSATN